MACCCGTEYEPGVCTDCLSNVIPGAVVVTISGATNNTCDNCDEWNTSFTLDYDGSCSYLQKFDGVGAGCELYPGSIMSGITILFGISYTAFNQDTYANLTIFVNVVGQSDGYGGNFPGQVLLSGGPGKIDCMDFTATFTNLYYYHSLFAHPCGQEVIDVTVVPA